MRAHYEVLKEHELNIIKDYEAKLSREKMLSEAKVSEIKVQMADSQHLLTSLT